MAMLSSSDGSLVTCHLRRRSAIPEVLRRRSWKSVQTCRGPRMNMYGGLGLNAGSIVMDPSTLKASTSMTVDGIANEDDENERGIDGC